jgi:hypothetical protein
VTRINVVVARIAYDSLAPNNNKEAIMMERLWKAVCGVLTVVSAGAVLAAAPMAAMAQDGGNGIGAATGGVTLEPAYQVGNAEGDGRGQ